MGALGDSFYEYLLKVWLLGSRLSTELRAAYDRWCDRVFFVVVISFALS